MIPVAPSRAFEETERQTKTKKAETGQEIKTLHLSTVISQLPAHHSFLKSFMAESQRSTNRAALMTSRVPATATSAMCRPVMFSHESSR